MLQLDKSPVTPQEVLPPHIRHFVSVYSDSAHFFRPFHNGVMNAMGKEIMLPKNSQHVLY